MTRKKKKFSTFYQNSLKILTYTIFSLYVNELVTHAINRNQL